MSKLRVKLERPWVAALPDRPTEQLRSSKRGERSASHENRFRQLSDILWSQSSFEVQIPEVRVSRSVDLLLAVPLYAGLCRSSLFASSRDYVVRNFNLEAVLESHCMVLNTAGLIKPIMT